jgi:hypothetical protein
VRRYRNVQRDSVFYRDRVLPAGPYDTGATGRLTIELNPGSHHGGRRFSDRQTSPLEERLPHLFREIEERIVRARYDAEDRQVTAERAAVIAEEEAHERHRTWLVLMERAADGLLRDQRESQLREQAQAWDEAARIRRYCDAAESEYGDRAMTIEWLAWARGHADALDPLASPPSTPELSEVTLAELQAYLPDGYSACGSDHGRMTRF